MEKSIEERLLGFKPTPQTDLYVNILLIVSLIAFLILLYLFIKESSLNK